MGPIGPSAGCLFTMFVFAVIGAVAAGYGVISGVVWLIQHVRFA